MRTARGHRVAAAFEEMAEGVIAGPVVRLI